MEIKAIPWEVNYRAMFGDISASRAQAWQDFILANVHALTPGEINNAMAVLCARARSDDRGQVRKPDVRDICNEIFTRRGVGHSTESERARQRFMDHCRAGIALAKDDAEAWEFICAPTDRKRWTFGADELRYADCEALLKFAQENAREQGREYQRPHFDGLLARMERIERPGACINNELQRIGGAP